MKTCLLALLFSVLLFSQTVSVTFHYKPKLQSFSTVRLAGSFQNWNINDPNYVMSFNSADNLYYKTISLSPGTYTYKFVVDGSYFTDPDNPVIVDPQYQNSQIVVSDPMVTYLLPIDTNTVTQTTLPNIKAIFAFNNHASVTPVITLKINGNSIAIPPGHYDSTNKTFDYALFGGQLYTGSNTILIGINIGSSFSTKTTKINVEPDPKFNLLTEDMIYKKPNILIYGRILTKQITGVIINFNGTDYNTMPDSLGNFAYPVNLKEDSNYVNVTVNSPYGSKSISQVLVYLPDNQPVITLSNSIIGRTASITANAVSPGGYSLSSYFWYQDPGNPAQVSLGDVFSQNISVSIPGIYGEYIFKVKVTDNRGRYNVAGYVIKSLQDSIHIEGISEHPGWVDKLNLYEIYTPSYGQTQFGLKGVLEKIDYLADLGINAIWMTPIFDGNYNGYAVKNYYKVNPALGTEDDLRQIVQKAHQKGIKVLLDLVISHTWTAHPFFQNILALKASSPFSDYYYWSGTPGISSFNYYYNWSDLPNLNVSNVELQNYLFNVAEYWIREFEIDGYRCDVAWGIEERNSNFWRVMRARLKNLKPEAFLLAESPASNLQEGHILDIFNNKFDAAYDWDLRGFGTGAFNSILTENSNTSSLNSVITKTYPVNAYPLRFIENHDFLRAANEFGLSKSKLAHTIVSTINGIPLIYGGGEVGELSQLNNINWSDPNNFKPYFKKLLNIRKNYIRNDANIIILSSSGSNMIDSYLTQSDTSLLLTIANFSSSPSSFTINFEGNIHDSTVYLNDLFNNTSTYVSVSGLNSVVFNLAAYEAKVYSLQQYSITSVAGNPSIVYNFQLSQNYPNPFNPFTTIRYSIPERSKVTLKIYDIIGRELLTLLNGEVNAGNYEINFNASKLSSGVYFYTLKSNNFVSTKKMLLIK
jgi:cyclomaltodextrinase / maltogenic alpha-amylase / neopullulanase